MAAKRTVFITAILDSQLKLLSLYLSLCRHYGALQGLDKQETVAKFGKDQVAIWRRSFDIPPPPVDESSPHNPANDEKYKNIPSAAAIRTESLKVCNSIVPCYVS